MGVKLISLPFLYMCILLCGKLAKIKATSNSKNDKKLEKNFCVGSILNTQALFNTDPVIC